MTAKEYLKQYREAVARVDLAQAHLTELHALAERITPNYSGGSGAHAHGDRLGAAVARIVDEEARIDREISRMAEIEQAVTEKIEAVGDERLRVILYRRYILGEKWEQIAVAMRLDYRWVLRLHGRALQAVQTTIDH